MTPSDAPSLRPDPRPDLLAAHSMDSVWFIVDAEGEVFQMDTSEAGALPPGIEAQNDAAYELEEVIFGEQEAGHFSAIHELPFVYVRNRPGPTVRWDDLPEALRARAGCLRLPVALRDAPHVDLAEHLDPRQLEYWAELSEVLAEIQVDAPPDEIAPFVERYAATDGGDGDVDWIFPKPAAPGEVVPSRAAPPQRASTPSPKGTTTEAPTGLWATIKGWFGG